MQGTSLLPNWFHKQFLTRKADKRKYANDKNGIRRKFEKYQSGQSRVFKWNQFLPIANVKQDSLQTTKASILKNNANSPFA